MTAAVFDFHVRLPPRPGFATTLLSTMDSAGIARAAVAAGGVVDLARLSAQIVDGGHVTTDADNEAVRDACDGSGGRLVPIWFGNPHADPQRYRRRAGGFRGLELSPAVHGLALTDPRNLTLVEVSAEHGHPVYVVPIGRPGLATADLVTLAEKFPEVNFVLGHAGFIGIDIHSINLVASHENVYVETSGCFSVTLRAALDVVGADRVLFGTEFPLQHPSVELAKYAALGLSEPVWQKVAWRNAVRLLGEERA